MINPRDFAIDPTGNFLVIASQQRGRVLVAAIDQNSGMLTKVGNATDVQATPVFVGIMVKP